MGLIDRIKKNRAKSTEHAGLPTESDMPKAEPIKVEEPKQEPYGGYLNIEPSKTIIKPIRYEGANELLDANRKRGRQEYVRSFDTWEDAEKAGDISMGEYTKERIEKLRDENKGMGVYEAALLANGSNETPNQIKKRERREQIGQAIDNLGNVIANIANINQVKKTGYNMDFNTQTEKNNERIEAARAKRKALQDKLNAELRDARLKDISYARSVAEAKRKESADRQNKVEQRAYDLMKFNANLTYKQAKDAAARELKQKELSVKMAGVKQREKEQREKENKVASSIIGDDGIVYTRGTRFSPEEIRVMASYVEDMTPYETKDDYGNVVKTDYVSAAADAGASGLIPTSYLRRIGAKPIKVEEEKKKEEKKSGSANDDKVPPTRVEKGDNVPPTRRKK